MSSKTSHKADSGSVIRSILVLVVAAVLGVLLFRSGPETVTEEEKRPPKIVKVEDRQPSNEKVSVTAYGTVIPARQVVVRPQVSGEVKSHHEELIPGGLVEAGEVLFDIDPRLIELSVDDAKAAVSRAEAVLKEAKRKKQEADRLAVDSVISATELASLESNVEMLAADQLRSQVSLERNRELLSRHAVKAPFNAIVLSEAVELGQRVDTGFEAATLVGVDEFWVRVSLTMEQLQWVELPNREGHGGAKVEVFLETGDGRDERREGRVVRLLGDLEREGRMARVLVSVEDPLGSSEALTAPLLIGSYVRVEIDVGVLENVIVMRRDALREGDRIWIADAENRLMIRDVDVKWRHGESVYIQNVLEAGERLIVSPLRSALPGMELNPVSVGGDLGQPLTPNM